MIFRKHMRHVRREREVGPLCVLALLDRLASKTRKGPKYNFNTQSRVINYERNKASKAKRGKAWKAIMYNVSHFKQIFDKGLKDWKTNVLIRWKFNCPLAISIPESRVHNNYDTK